MATELIVVGVMSFTPATVPVSSTVTEEFFNTFPVARSNLAIALFVELAAPSALSPN